MPCYAKCTYKFFFFKYIFSFMRARSLRCVAAAAAGRLFWATAAYSHICPVRRPLICNNYNVIKIIHLLYWLRTLIWVDLLLG